MASAEQVASVTIWHPTGIHFNTERGSFWATNKGSLLRTNLDAFLRLKPERI